MPSIPSHPSLTVLSSAHRNAGLAARALATCRMLDPRVPLEIVVGVDSRTPREGMGELQDVADRVIEFEFTGPNRFRPWLREQALGEWLLLLDSDEFPSAALLNRLPALLQDKSTDGYWIPFRNPFPTTWTYPIGEHWSQDVHLRLVRNDGELRFPGTKHAETEHPGRKRRIAEPVIHLHLLLDGQATRREKVGRYEGHAFGLMTHTGLPLNRANYLPEDSVNLELATMAGPDAQRAKEILAGLKSPGRPATAPLPRVTGQQVERWLDFLPIAPQDAKGTIEVTSAPPAVAAGSQFPVELRVRNDGPAIWHPANRTGASEHPTRVSYHWNADGRTLVFEGTRTELPARVLPDEEMLMTIHVISPDVPGPAKLVLDVMQEGVRWFGLDVELPVLVEPSAGQQLLAAATPLVPLAEAVTQRRRLWHRDALSHALPVPEPDTYEGLPVGGWALDRAKIDYLRDLMRRERLGRVLEFGSGTSTMLLGEVACELGGSLLSLDQDPQFAARSQELVAQRGLSGCVTVSHCGLAPVGACGTEVLSYHLSAQLREQIAALAPQLVLIDGPSQVSGGSRLATAPSLIGLVPTGTTFALDDAFRDAELEVGRRWDTEDRLRLAGILPLGTGLLLGTIDPPA